MNSDVSILDDFFSNKRRKDHVVLKELGTDKENADGCSVYDLRYDRHYIIEDDDFARQLVEAMIRCGFPVFLKDELPPARLVIADIVSELIQESIPLDLINRVNRTLYLKKGTDVCVIDALLASLRLAGVLSELRRKIQDEFNYQVRENR